MRLSTILVLLTILGLSLTSYAKDYINTDPVDASSDTTINNSTVPGTYITAALDYLDSGVGANFLIKTGEWVNTGDFILDIGSSPFEPHTRLRFTQNGEWDIIGGEDFISTEDMFIKARWDVQPDDPTEPSLHLQPYNGAKLLGLFNSDRWWTDGRFWATNTSMTSEFYAVKAIDNVRANEVRGGDSNGWVRMYNPSSYGTLQFYESDSGNDSVWQLGGNEANVMDVYGLKALVISDSIMTDTGFICTAIGNTSLFYSINVTAGGIFAGNDSTYGSISLYDTANAQYGTLSTDNDALIFSGVDELQLDSMSLGGSITDPTLDSHVGDRGYNDTRYIERSSGWTGVYTNKMATETNWMYYMDGQVTGIWNVTYSYWHPAFIP